MKKIIAIIATLIVALNLNAQTSGGGSGGGGGGSAITPPTHSIPDMTMFRSKAALVSWAIRNTRQVLVFASSSSQVGNGFVQGLGFEGTQVGPRTR